MDKLDYNVIRSLNENARKSFRHVAKELNVSLSTISNRVKRLEEENYVIYKRYHKIYDNRDDLKNTSIRDLKRRIPIDHKKFYLTLLSFGKRRCIKKRVP